MHQGVISIHRFFQNLAISLGHTWETMRENPWLKSGIKEKQGCTEEKIDDCNKNHWVIQDTENIFGVDDGLKVVCRKFKKLVFQLINYQFNTIFLIICKEI